MTAPAIDSSLKTRTKSAGVLALAVLPILYAGGIPFALMMLAVMVISVYEWGRMVLKGPRFRKRLLVLGAIYIGSSTGAIIWLRDIADNGLYNALTLLLLVWASDISAYFAGKTIGGAKLAPTISPKKTWAGFIGSSVGAAVVTAAITHPWFLEKSDAISTVGGLSWQGYALMGFVLAMFGQIGDLLVSLAKRYCSIKDTGALIPGHGGILDRIDALLLVALLFGALIKFYQ